VQAPTLPKLFTTETKPITTAARVFLKNWLKINYGKTGVIIWSILLQFNALGDGVAIDRLESEYAIRLILRGTFARRFSSITPVVSNRAKREIFYCLSEDQ
jgi:hypothetical protein